MGTAGLNLVTWNGKDNAGNDASSGVYFFKLSAGIYNATSKMVLMK
jgi:flagellar hook assembly protein FlgD